MPQCLLISGDYSGKVKLKLTGDRFMNKDQVKGTAKDIAGKVQEEAGRAVGSKEHEAKGLGKQVSGKAQKKYGDAKEAAKDAADEL
jgi:uncharacterized protein YjbJ (UPF0337 family)